MWNIRIWLAFSLVDSSPIRGEPECLFLSYISAAEMENNYAINRDKNNFFRLNIEFLNKILFFSNNMKVI